MQESVRDSASATSRVGQRHSVTMATSNVAGVVAWHGDPLREQATRAGAVGGLPGRLAGLAPCRCRVPALRGLRAVVDATRFRSPPREPASRSAATRHRVGVRVHHRAVRMHRADQIPQLPERR